LGNKKAYGDSKGEAIGFMDDLTPCRVSEAAAGPWFRLNKPFMDVRQMRCFSGPPDQKGFRLPDDGGSMQRVLLWYAIGRAFAQDGYPLWTDGLELWPPETSAVTARELVAMAATIVYADNECVDAVFPAGNPVSMAREAVLINPLTPAERSSRWNTQLGALAAHACEPKVRECIDLVDSIFSEWKRRFRAQSTIKVHYKRAYFIGPGVLRPTAGLVQIHHYAEEQRDRKLLDLWHRAGESTRALKASFHQLLLSGAGGAYFGAARSLDRRFGAQRSAKATRPSPTAPPAYRSRRRRSAA
jgi:hypothetical protein